MLTLAQRLEKYIYENEVSNKDLVQIIEVVGSYLNLQTKKNKEATISSSNLKKNENVLY